MWTHTLEVQVRQSVLYHVFYTTTIGTKGWYVPGREYYFFRILLYILRSIILYQYYITYLVRGEYYYFFILLYILRSIILNYITDGRCSWQVLSCVLVVWRTYRRGSERSVRPWVPTTPIWGGADGRSSLAWLWCGGHTEVGRDRTRLTLNLCVTRGYNLGERRPGTRRYTNILKYLPVVYQGTILYATAYLAHALYQVVPAWHSSRPTLCRHHGYQVWYELN